jgi:proteic killer suppression protein
MIKGFKDAATEAVFNGENPGGALGNILKVARRKLAMVNAAVTLNDLKSPPKNKLHALKDDRAGQHAIKVNDQYRVCFIWTDEGPTEVEITDYHD